MRGVLMSYLNLIADKIQSLAESLSSVLNVDITVVDHNLIRVAGTGDFYHRINETSPTDSLFASVLKNGIPELNIYNEERLVCRECSYREACKERNSMIHPLSIDGEIIGVVCFASFDSQQDEGMLTKKEEYFGMLQHFAQSIEKDIEGTMLVNKLNMGAAEINCIINSINRGILIINNENRITHINAKAIKNLGLNLSVSRILNKKVSSIIKEFKIKETNNREVIDTWRVDDTLIKVLYKANYLMIDNKNISTIVNFDTMDEIITAAMTYNSDNSITFDNIVGRSQGIHNVIEKAKIASKSDSTIFLHGSSGTGKELFARSIHNESLRKEGPFIAINCATLPENLIESELFGYEKGSFTGANPKGRIGKFEQANNGTIFLDEIADLPLHLQAKLLRVLQENKIDRLGSSSSTDINVRIICATHRNLEEMVKNSQFREDLYYRLNVIPLNIPDLKDRGDDVLLCSEYIVKKLCSKLGKTQKNLSKEVEGIFMSYSWPGNVRELENVLEYAINFTFDDIISAENLPQYFLNSVSTMKLTSKISDLFNVDLSSMKNLNEMTKEYEKRLLTQLLERYGDTTDSKKMIAERLGLSVTTLYRKINGY